MKFILLLILFTSISLGVAQEVPTVFKNQNQSSTKWGEIDINSFLSFKDWKDQTDERSQVPEWETIVRDRNNREIVGRFFQCVGKCRIDRGNSFFNANFRSAIYEGDEVQTIGESFAWIYLLDGTMVRLSPESSVNFNELNIGVKENFLNARVNVGNVVWLSRSESLFEEINARETDVLFNPLVLYEAQPISDRKPYNEDDLISMVTEKETILNQYKHLNELILENNKTTKGKPTYSFIVMPNISLMGYDVNAEIVSLIGGQTYFKKRSSENLGLKKSDKNDSDLEAQLRGFENKELVKIENDKWQVVDEKGKILVTTFENLNWLTMGEFITKRIPSLLVARELMFTKYSHFAFKEKYNPKELAVSDGYRLWGALHKVEGEKKDDLELRLDFLKEYFRRIETTNLVVSGHFSERLKERGEDLKAMEYGNYFFIKAIDKYYSYEELNTDDEKGEILNSTTKKLWKQMHGIR